MRFWRRVRAGLRIFRMIQTAAPDVVDWRRRLQSAVDTRATLTLTTDECEAVLRAGRPVFELADRIAGRFSGQL